MFGGLLGNESPFAGNTQKPKISADAPVKSPAVKAAPVAKPAAAAPAASAASPEQSVEQAGAAYYGRQADVEQAKQQTEYEAAQAKAEVMKDSVGRERGMIEQADRDTWAEPAFNPTKNTPLEIGKIFSMIATMGIMSGGGGKLGAMQAMNAMTGMLKGYQAGDQAAYERAKTEYDEGIKTIQSHNAQILQHLEKAMTLEATDREAAMVEKEMAARLAGSSSIITKQLEMGKAQSAYETAKGVLAQHNKLEEVTAQRRLIEDEAARARQYQRETSLMLVGARTEQKAGETASWLNDTLGTNFNAAQATQVVNAAEAMAEAKELQNIVTNKPSIVGREGQARQFTDRYIQSFISGTPAPQDTELADPNDAEAQEALVFAKRYASYLIKYEKALVGSGGKNFTVQLQNRWNALLSQNQFSAAGLVNVLDEQIRDVSSSATSLSKKLDKDFLTNLGTDIKQWSVGGISTATPAPSGAGTHKEGDKDVSKSGRPMTWINGKWHYDDEGTTK